MISVIGTKFHDTEINFEMIINNKHDTKISINIMLMKIDFCENKC